MRSGVMLLESRSTGYSHINNGGGERREREVRGDGGERERAGGEGNE